ncbi:MAG: hypothetical protein ACRETC_11560 [Gammaproteobacteria bacterium]
MTGKVNANPSKREQIVAVFDGRASNLIKEYYRDADDFNFTSYLTFTREDLMRFLGENSDIVKTYAEKCIFSDTKHDVCAIMPVHEGYIVAWLDHGRPMNPKTFSNLEEAVTEQVLGRYGIYS